VPDGEPTRIAVGYVRRAHGLDGSVILRPLTDAPAERFVPQAAFVTDEGVSRTLTLRSVRQHKDGLLLTFEEISGRNDADALRGVTLTIDPSERRDLTPDEFWEEDLVGRTVVDPEDNPLGSVLRLVLGAAQDRLVVLTPSGDEVEVPFVEAIVTDVPESAGPIVVDAPSGLF